MKKPDFDRFLLQSTFLQEEAERAYTGSFSFSAGKLRLFLFCKRAWFFHYILAQGGWDKYADALCQEAYIQKYLLTFPAFLSRILTSAIRESLPAIREEIKEEKRLDTLRSAIRYNASKIIFLSHNFLREGGMENDPRKLSFYDLYYPTGKFENAEDLIESGKDILRNFLPQFFHSDLFRTLASFPAVAWNYGEQFPSFTLRGITVFLPPSLYALTGGNFYRFSFSFSFARTLPEETTLSDGIFSLYAEKRFPGHKGKRAMLHFQTEENILQEKVCSPRKADEEVILTQAHEMLKVLQKPQMEYFPCTEEKENCLSCRFRKVCEKLQ